MRSTPALALARATVAAAASGREVEGGGEGGGRGEGRGEHNHLLISGSSISYYYIIYTGIRILWNLFFFLILITPCYNYRRCYYMKLKFVPFCST